MEFTSFRSLIPLTAILVCLIGCKPAAGAYPLKTTETPAEEKPTTSIQPTIQSDTPSASSTLPAAPLETAVINIPLTGDVNQRGAEISGMAWYGDWLILLPQYPDFGGGSGDGRVFALSREDILEFIRGEIPGPLTPLAIPFVAPGLSNNIEGYEGYEAIIFSGDTVYLTIEASPASGMIGHLVKGTMAQDLSELNVATDLIANISSATGLSNKSEEALLFVDDTIITIHEANGKDINPSPAATRFDLDLEPVGTLPFASIDYRITDATVVDEYGHFWAINYFYPGEPELLTEHDPVTEAYGQGATHALQDGVERLLEFKIEDGAITLLDQPPIQLELLADDLRNWEGIARLEGHGFLLATDKFPQTILGFVPYP